MSGSLFTSPEDLVDDLIDADLNPDIFSLNTADFKRCPNIIEWTKSKKYIGITPFPRQVEILVNLFEEFCPLCSDMGVVKDMWGKTLDEIFSKVVLLENATCPCCSKNKRDFRQMGLIKDYQELVGVAGQRCLDPSTKVIAYSGEAIPLSQVKEGTWLRRADGAATPAIVKAVVGSVQPGYFLLHFEGLKEPVKCSDGHHWAHMGRKLRPGPERLIPTVELKEGDLIKCWDNFAGYRVLNKIEKHYGECNLIDLEIEDHHLFMADNGLCLHNSGKTAITAMIATYITHQYLTLDVMPYEVFGLTPTTLRATFVATSKGQASETLWQNVLDLIDVNPWFSDYHTFLMDEQSRTGEEYYKRLGESINYRNKAIALKFEAANPAKLRGRTRFIGSLDELGLFPSGQGYAESGQECYTSLNNSLRTLRSASRELIDRGMVDPPKGWMLSVSSPMAEDDPIMPLLETAKTSSKMYAFHYATWEINPTIKMEDLKDDMLKDPVKFWRDFGAQPPTASDAFIAQPEMVDALHSERPNALSYTFGKMQQTIGNSTYFYRTLLPTATKPHDVAYPRVLCIDAGEVENSYAFAIGYYDFEREKTVLEAIAEIEPETTANGQLIAVSFDKANDVFIQLKPIFNISMMVADRWNSTLTLEVMRKAGIEAFKHSPKMHEFKLFRARLFNKEAEIPAYDAESGIKHPSAMYPVARCVIQSKTVKELGNRLTKPAIGSDDGFRAWALLDIICNEYKDELAKQWEANKQLALMGQSKKSSLFGASHRVSGRGLLPAIGGARSGTVASNNSSFRRVKR